MKNKQIWIILSAVCILSGIFFIILGTVLGGVPGFYLDQTGIHTAREQMKQIPETFRQTIELESFDCMDIEIDYADVILVPSDRYAVNYCLTGFSKAPLCQVDEGKLIFRENPQEPDFKIWFFYHGPVSNVNTNKIPESFLKVEYPADQAFSEVIINLESGELTLPALCADALKIDNAYGDVTLKGYTGTQLLLHMSSGDLTAGTVYADQAELKNEYGKITLEQYTGKQLTVNMSSGDLTLGTIETDQADLKNEYGSVLIQQASGGRLSTCLESGSFRSNCLDFSSLDMKNEYSTVYLKLAGSLDDYDYNLYTEYGSIMLDDKNIKPEEENSEISYVSQSSGKKAVNVSCDSGDIIISPTE